MTAGRERGSVAASFIRSALAAEGRFLTIDDLRAKFEEKKTQSRYSIERIPFRELDHWRFEPGSGNLVHDSGKFFRIEGLRVRTNFGGDRTWEQPIINQPEVGILGILTKQFGGVRYFLMQAKMEPGNINTVQLSPTVQATKSNYTRVHQGKLPLFLEYFLDRTRFRVLFDQLHSEQGARFWRKRNRNMIVDTEANFVLPPDFYWLTLGQIKRLLAVDDFVNMDARSVLSCVPLGIETPGTREPARPAGRKGSPAEGLGSLKGFSRDMFLSITDRSRSVSSSAEIISWFTELKTRYECAAELIPLKDVQDWVRTDREISHPSKKYFSIMAVSVRAECREVQCWTQPLLRQATVGLVGFLVKKIKGLLHVLVQAKVEAGYIDMLELAPTVSFSETGPHAPRSGRPPFASHFLDPDPDRVRLSVILSEEGGRFYHSQNKYMIIELEPTSEIDLPENFAWMTFGQLLEFTQHSNYVNVETRSLLACLNFGPKL